MKEIKFRAWDKRFNMMVYQLADGYKLTLSGKVVVLNYNNKVIRESDEFELMQYTGLKDKNGVEIYEGDILSTFMGRKEIKGIMGWNENGRWAEFYPLNKFEIIGNIYENPEQLNKNQNSE